MAGAVAGVYHHREQVGAPLALDHLARELAFDNFTRITAHLQIDLGKAAANEGLLHCLLVSLRIGNHVKLAVGLAQDLRRLKAQTLQERRIDVSKRHVGQRRDGHHHVIISKYSIKALLGFFLRRQVLADAKDTFGPVPPANPNFGRDGQQRSVGRD